MVYDKVEYIKGDIVENGKITVEIDGKQIERVVRHNKEVGLSVCRQFLLLFFHFPLYPL